MTEKGFILGKIFGIELRVDTSWFVIFLLVTFNLRLGLFPFVHPEWDPLLSWGLAVLASILFFGSVLAHEVAHSLVANARGLPVRKIVLFLFGGVADIEKEPNSAKTEFLVSIVGPMTSLILGVLFLLLSGGGLSLMFSVYENPVILSAFGPLSTLLLWLGSINIILGLFNLVPGFPLDGGRIFRSAIWALSGNLKIATGFAASLGQAIAWGFIFIGISMIFGVEVPFFGSGIIGGLWIAFIGWFLSSAAQQNYREQVVSSLLKNVHVNQLMRGKLVEISKDMTISELVAKNILRTEDRSFAVTEGKKVIGVICFEDIQKINQGEWDKITVGQIMTPSENLQPLTPYEEAAEAARKLNRTHICQIPVIEKGRLVGSLSRRDIELWLGLHSKGIKLSG